MLKIQKAFALTLLTMVPMSLFPCTGTWNGSLSGNYDVSTNWTPTSCIPGSGGPTDTDTAIFGPISTTSYTVSLDSPPISPGLSSLTFNTASSDYTFKTTTAQQITFNDTAGASTFTLNGATNPVIQPLVTLSGAHLTVSIPTATSSATMLGGMQVTGGSSHLILDGAGTLLILNDGSLVNGTPFTFSGTLITLNGGTLEFNNTASRALNQNGITAETGHFDMNPNTSLIIMNNGAITGGSGVTFFTTDAIPAFTLTSATVLAQNLGTITGTAQGVSVTIEHASLSSGTWTSINTGQINNSGSIGVFTDFQPGTIAGANVINSSAGMNTVNAGIGAMMEFDDVGGSPGFGMTAGTFTNTNSASVQAAGIGAQLLANTQIHSTGGTITNINTGNISTGGTGSLLTSETIVLSGGNLVNTNLGTVDSTSIGSLVVALTSINVDTGGTLNNNDTVQTPVMNVNSGGTVFGTGTFQGVSGAPTTTFTNNGLVVPGPTTQPAGTPGQMNIAGSFVNGSTGTLLMNLETVSNSSLLNVTGPNGTATLGGNLELALTPGAEFPLGSNVTIIEAAAGVINTFDPIINFNLPANSFQVLYFPNSVVVHFLLPAGGNLLGVLADSFLIESGYVNLFEPIFAVTNHKNFGLDRRMGQLRNKFTKVRKNSSSDQYSTSARRVNPVNISSNTDPVILTTSANMSQVSLADREFETEIGTSTKQLPQENLVNKMTSQTLEDRPWTFYMGPTGDVGKVNKMHNSAQYNYWTVGALAGFDYAWEQAGIGFLVNYDHIHGSPHHNWGHFTENKGHATLYATMMPHSSGEFVINTIVGGGYGWYDVHRKTGLEGSREMTHGKPNGAEFDALVGFEYVLEKKRIRHMPSHLQLVPLFNVQYMSAVASRYKEKGSELFNLKYKPQHGRSLRTTLGARVNYMVIRENYTVTPEFNLAWQTENMDKSRKLSFQPVDLADSSTSFHMGKVGRQLAVGGFDLLITMFEQYGIDLNYNFEWNKKFHDHFFYIGANFNF